VQQLIILKSFGVDIHPRKAVSYVLVFWLPPSNWFKCYTNGRLKALLAYLVVEEYLEIIMLPLWVISLHILVFIMPYMQRWCDLGYGSCISKGWTNFFMGLILN